MSAGGQLVRKYAVFVASALCLALVFNGIVNTIFAFRDQHALVVRVQQEKADFAAQRIGQFVSDIMRQLDWVSQLGPTPTPTEDRRLDGLRLMRQIAAISEFVQIDASGREFVALSRTERDRIDSGRDWSDKPAFRNAQKTGDYYGPVWFRRGSEPYMDLAKAGPAPRRDVALATINLTYILYLMSRLTVGEEGRAYVVDGAGRLIAHPDLRFVLRDTNLAEVVTRHEAAHAGEPDYRGVSMRDMEGRAVLSVMAPVPWLDWRVIVDLPESEAFAPIYDSILRSLIVLVLVLVLAVFASVLLSRRMAAPIRALSEGAARIGEGHLDERIEIRSGDELERLGDEFNRMAERLHESRSALEDKVAERTRALAEALERAFTEHRAADDARRAAEQATQAKSRFLAVVGHDIRTPLSGVLGVLEILDRKRMTRRDRRLIDMALTSGETLIDLANATLDLSRLEAGTELLDPRDFEPHALLTAAMALIRPAAEKKGLELVPVLAGLGGARVHGDPGKINRVVLNLLRNAVNFTEAGTIRLEGGVAAPPDGGRRLWVRVKDTGPGIAAEMQERIFQDFVQAETGLRRADGGVGLGLAICRKLSDLLGGSLTVTSVPGEGSCFAFEMPVETARGGVEPQEPVAAVTARVLVVDDEPVTREVAQILVGRAGHLAQVARSGEEAVEIVRATPIDVVLLDMHMSGMDGVATVAAIRALAGIRQPRIIALTADMSPETAQRLRQVGLTTILSKPATSMALRQALSGRRRPVRGAPPVVLDREQPVDRSFFASQRELIGEERLAKLIDLFAVVSSELLAAMRLAARDGDVASLERLAHQLASAAGAIGLGRVVAGAGGVERSARRLGQDELAARVEELDEARGEALACLAEIGAELRRRDALPA
jgi:signal transduction histidine kinase/DNA-binding response OmpR family regulator